MRASTTVAQKKRYTARLSDFRGVDLSSSPLRVSTSRATYMRNFISENGVNHKRPGWRELFCLDGEINGIFPYKDGTHDVLLVHAGNKIYRAWCEENLWSTEDLTGDLVLTNSKSQCFYRDGKAFIIGCGEYLVYGAENPTAQEKVYSLKRVADIAYVPTTTILRRNNEEASGATFDAVNLLTPLRKNTLIGSTNTLTSTTDSRWWLDGSIDIDSTVTIEVDFSLNGEMKTARFSGKFGSASGRADLNDDSELTEADLRTIGVPGTYYFSLHKNYIEPLFSTDPHNRREDNIKVTFSCKTDGYEEKIKNCTVGTLFGLDGANDRLFLSGNPDERGMDRWSEAGDFTYFPDGNAMYVGGNESCITGYARLSDATLAVFKEEARGYPTIYYRTGRETTIADADGVQVPAVYFPVVPGTVGEGILSPHAIANLAGDPLILSQNGVFGVELSANVSSGERYARERSRAVYEELRKKDLSKAVACVFRGRYFLSTGDGVCYIADSRYKTTFEGSSDTGYEWWVWDNIFATAFAVHEEGLLFGDKKGRLCRFCEGVFYDETRIEIEDGELYQTLGGGLCFREALSFCVGDNILFKSDLYALLLNNAGITSEGEISFPQGLLHKIRDGMTVYVDNVGESGLQARTPYTICDVDPVSLTFRLCDETGVEALPLAGGFRLCLNLKGQKHHVAAVYPQTSTLFLSGEDSATFLQIVLYEGIREISILGVATRSTPVVARWRTPVMDFGTPSAKKCLLGITVTNEPGVIGAVKISMETRLLARELLKHGGDDFSLENLDLSALSFASGFAESCRRRVNVRNFNYAVFEFVSDTANDVAVNGIELEYKINQVNRGVH